MAKYGRRPASASRNLRAKSAARLRVECLETRRLLSAIALPLLPLAPPPLFAAAGGFSRGGGQHLARAILQNVMPNAAGMLRPNPTLAPDQRAPLAGDSSYEPPYAGDRLGEPAHAHDDHRSGEPMNDAALLLDATFEATPNAMPEATPDAPNGIADSGSGAPTENPSDTSQAINLDATTRQVGQETTMDPIAASPVTFSLEMPPSDLLFSPDMTGEWSLSMTLTIYDQPPRYSGEMAPNAPPAGNPAKAPRATSDVPAMIETLSLNRGLAGYRAPEPPCRQRGPIGRQRQYVIECGTVYVADEGSRPRYAHSL